MPDHCDSTAEKLYNMKLHDTHHVKKCFLVTRVPGGWWYRGHCQPGGENGIFVKLDNEFKPE